MVISSGIASRCGSLPNDFVSEVFPRQMLRPKSVWRNEIRANLGERKYYRFMEQFMEHHCGFVKTIASKNPARAPRYRGRLCVL